MLTDKEIAIIKTALIYDLRRRLKKSGKQTYTKEEFCDWLDTIADEIDKE